jgi:hypothetical protein
VRGIHPIDDGYLEAHPDQGDGINGCKDNCFICKYEHRGLARRAGLPNQVGNPMERLDRSIKERLHLLAEAMEARLWRVHALAVQTPVAGDPLMRMTLDAHHRRSLAGKWQRAMPLQNAWALRLGGGGRSQIYGGSFGVWRPDADVFRQGMVNAGTVLCLAIVGRRA